LPGGLFVFVVELISWSTDSSSRNFCEISQPSLAKWLLPTAGLSLLSSSINLAHDFRPMHGRGDQAYPSAD
jgi:hypothetical protein